MGNSIQVPAIANNVVGTGFSAIDLFGVMVSKRAGELLLYPMVGNSTWKSAIIKFVGAILIYAGANTQHGIIRKGGHIVSAGMAFDAFEDASIALLGANPLGKFLQPANNGATVASSGISYVNAPM